MTTDDLIKLLQTGAGVSFDAETKTKEELMKIVGTAQKADTVVTLKNLGGRDVEELLEIIGAGIDSVYLEL